MAGIEENAALDARQQLLSISIGENQCCRFAAQLHDAWNCMFGGATQNTLTGTDGTGEDDLVDIAMAGHVGAHFTTAAANQVDRTPWQTGTFDGLHQHA
ncbi:hypothetical protein D3C77_540180 [compost metagenome]